jgi:uncharacterized protein with PIN domain
MTNEEAIGVLKNVAWLGTDKKVEEVERAIYIAVDALQKQIPKKPKRVNKNDIFDGNWRKICPTCGRVLMERITTNVESYPRHYNMSGFCWCGQAIDWGTEK